MKKLKIKKNIWKIKNHEESIKARMYVFACGLPLKKYNRQNKIAIKFMYLFIYLLFIYSWKKSNTLWLRLTVHNWQNYVNYQREKLK